MLKYDIMFCSLGNGVTVCNRNQIKNGDYKTIAHISAGGNVKYYEDKNKMPDYAVKSIENMAALERKKFQENFIKKPKPQQYEIILDALPIDKLLELPKDAYSVGWNELLNYFFSIA